MILVALVALVVGCGGDSVSSGGGGAGAGTQGPTTHNGVWELIANVAITIGEAANNFVHTTNVSVNEDGSAIVTATDANCSIIVRVSGNTLSYEERCSFGSGCVVTFFTQAGILGSSLSAPIGPERFVCSGLATSYSGNLIGTKCDPDCPSTPTATATPSPTPTTTTTPTPTPTPTSTPTPTPTPTP